MPKFTVRSYETHIVWHSVEAADRMAAHDAVVYNDENVELLDRDFYDLEILDIEEDNEC